MKLRNKVAAASAVVGGLAATGANAEVPTAASNAFTTLSTDGLAMVELAWPVLAGLTGAFLLIKIFKRAAGKL